MAGEPRGLDLTGGASLESQTAEFDREFAMGRVPS